MIFNPSLTVDLCMVCALMLMSMTVTLMQGLANEDIQRGIIWTTKQAISIKLTATVGHENFYSDIFSSLHLELWSYDPLMQ